jgi:hypothetical protein
VNAKGKVAVQEAPGDLRQQREEFVRSFLHKSAELTEELIRDNQAMEEQLREQREENARLRAQLASSDAVRELLGTVDRLEQERKQLLLRQGELSVFEQRQADTERELNDLASLYVASFQLSSSLSIGRVIKHMCELMEQLVGAQSFVFYLLAADGKRAIPVSAQGKLPAALAPLVLEDGTIADACLTGVPRISEPDAPRAAGEPIAVLPLQFASQVIGVFAVYELLPHKHAWVKVDHELFKLLAVHGATALIAANLYAKEAGPRAALQDVLLNLESERHRQLLAAGQDYDAGGEL